jgi:hypothetical protein
MTTLVVGIAAVIGLIAVSKDDSPGAQKVSAAASPTDPSLTPLPGTPAGVSPSDITQVGVGTATTIAGTPVDSVQDLAGDDPAGPEACTLTVQSLRLGATGQSVNCLQQALADNGYYSNGQTGEFDQATYDAARTMQEDRNLFVDGIVGRESAISLGIWPDEASLVVHTPPPANGAVDLLGYPLSSVATSGPDAPPLPENSGTGKRLVYDRAGQRVWAVDKNERVIRSWLVAGSKYSNETPGTHEVYSRSDVSTAWNGKAWLPKMVRWLKTDIGAIGFHAIPLHVNDNSPYQTEAELGQRLSGGCQRQANRDADFTWDFAQIGTKVVVI